MNLVRVGISGWRYEPWRKVFYPYDLAQHRELEFAARAPWRLSPASHRLHERA